MAQPGIIGEKEFARLITTQDNFSLSDMQTIDRLIAQYPYCQAFYYIQSAALKRARSEKFESQLQRSAAFSPNRESLFRYIEKPRELRAFLNPPAEVQAATVSISNDANTAPDREPVLIEENDVSTVLAAEGVGIEVRAAEGPVQVLDGVEEESATSELNAKSADLSLAPEEQAATVEESSEELGAEIEVGAVADLTEIPEEQPVSSEDDEFTCSQDIDSPDEDVEEQVALVEQIDAPIVETSTEAHPEEDLQQEVQGVELSEEINVESDALSLVEEPEFVEEEVFEEISEVASVEQLVASVVAPIEKEEEAADLNHAAIAEQEDQEAIGIVSDTIETAIPFIETPEEEFAKPEIDLQESVTEPSPEVSSSDSINSERVLAVAPLVNVGIEIETVIPDFDLPGFADLVAEGEAPVEEKRNAVEAFHVEQNVKEEPAPGLSTKPDFPEERLMLDSVAARDYFVFDRSVVDPLGTSSRESKEIKESESLPAVAVVNIEEAPVVPADPVGEAGKEAEDVSKYHDDTLPFSFLWWLHKTRKEHDATYQPYISRPNLSAPVSAAPASTDLNQQIMESIFHAQPELNTFPESTAVTYSISPKKREGDLIERFIKEEPHIKPPMPDKLDTENKAKRSSEDSLDLVSETLAKIYIDQMLFHKAIDTYKKLSLKFPEKSTYFADQISDLQKKIN